MKAFLKPAAQWIAYLLPAIMLSSYSRAQTSDREIDDRPDTMPEFPGGKKAMKIFLEDHLIYPSRALDEQIEGKGYLRFMVSDEGKINDIKVMRGYCGLPGMRQGDHTRRSAHARLDPGNHKRNSGQCHTQLYVCISATLTINPQPNNTQPNNFQLNNIQPNNSPTLQLTTP